MDENDSKEPKKPLSKKVMRFSGIAFMAIGGLTIMGWMQGRDPDCALAEVGIDAPTTYLRMCEMEIALAQTDVWWPLAISIVTIIWGWVLIQLSNKK
jgi:hypothetical protein